jgi:Predicted metal-binding integral membrane protein
MSMGGMDMTGFRMIPSGQSLMMPASEPWKPIEFAFVFAMWAVMMVGMMTPSVAPMILIYARVGRQAAIDNKPFAATAWFVGGYLLAWTGFSLAATSAQWALERAALLTPMMASASNILGGVVLIVPASINGRRSRRRACSIASRRSHSSCATGASAAIRPGRWRSACGTESTASAVAGR